MKESMLEREALQHLAVYSKVRRIWSVEVGALECVALQTLMGRWSEAGDCCLHLDRVRRYFVC